MFIQEEFKAYSEEELEELSEIIRDIYDENIPEYNYEIDCDSPYPWCTPWLWSNQIPVELIEKKDLKKIAEVCLSLYGNEIAELFRDFNNDEWN